MYVYIYIYIYIYTHDFTVSFLLNILFSVPLNYGQSRTNIVDFRGFDSDIIFTQRGGILMSIGNFPESLSQAILVGIILVGRLGVESRRVLQGVSRRVTVSECRSGFAEPRLRVLQGSGLDIRVQQCTSKGI